MCVRGDELARYSLCHDRRVNIGHVPRAFTSKALLGQVASRGCYSFDCPDNGVCCPEDLSGSPAVVFSSKARTVWRRVVRD